WPTRSDVSSLARRGSMLFGPVRTPKTIAPRGVAACGEEQAAHNPKTHIPNPRLQAMRSARRVTRSRGGARERGASRRDALSQETASRNADDRGDGANRCAHRADHVLRQSEVVIERVVHRS